MDANLIMQNNMSEEEPAAYFQRVFKLNRLDANKNEHTYMKLIECGGKISMDEYMELVGKEKPDASENTLPIHGVSDSTLDELIECADCNLKHTKGERIRKSDGTWETYHCPECDSESYYTL